MKSGCGIASQHWHGRTLIHSCNTDYVQTMWTVVDKLVDMWLGQ